LRAVFILEDGFRENVFASAFFFFFFFSSFSFFLVVRGTGGDAGEQVEQKKCFCSFPRRSSILTTAKKEKKNLNGYDLSSVGS